MKTLRQDFMKMLLQDKHESVQFLLELNHNFVPG